MRYVAYLVAVGMVWASSALAQTTCVQIGTLLDCSSSSGYSSTVVPLGPTGGVIIDNQHTEPYTVITQPGVTPPTTMFQPAVPPVPTYEAPIPSFDAPIVAPLEPVPFMILGE